MRGKEETELEANKGRERERSWKERKGERRKRRLENNKKTRVGSKE